MIIEPENLTNTHYKYTYCTLTYAPCHMGLFPKYATYYLHAQSLPFCIENQILRHKVKWSVFYILR